MRIQAQSKGSARPLQGWAENAYSQNIKYFLPSAMTPPIPLNGPRSAWLSLDWPRHATLRALALGVGDTRCDCVSSSPSLAAPGGHVPRSSYQMKSPDRSPPGRNGRAVSLLSINRVRSVRSYGQFAAKQ